MEEKIGGEAVYQAVFKRYELKYLLTQQQKSQLLKVLQNHMQPDIYGKTTIRNVYFDTDTYRLIRRSLEKPVYKEKMRIRSYEKAGEWDRVYVELKKKYQSVVYKRRLEMPRDQAMLWLCTGQGNPTPSQIAEEIEYFRGFYQTLRPTVFLSYDREAWYSPQEDFRVTFDKNILSRQEDLCLGAEIWGTPLLPEDQVLLELKTPGGIPLWMTRFLTEQKLYKTSFSKYGTAYCRQIFQTDKGEHSYV